MSKELYVRKILEKYKVIVDFEGEPPLKNVPSPTKEAETFKQWCARVLHGCTNVRIYLPEKPSPQVTMTGLKRRAQTDQLEAVFKAVNRLHKKKSNQAVEVATKITQEKLVSVPQETIVDIRNELVDTLEPSVSEFLQRLSDDAEGESLKIDDALRKIVVVYNDAARRARSMS